ncbi:hypothetical protein HUJ04_001291 [Dendroctonus ponderosae]
MKPKFKSKSVPPQPNKKAAKKQPQKKHKQSVTLAQSDLLNQKAAAEPDKSSQTSGTAKTKAKKTDRSSEYVKLDNQYKCANCPYTTDRIISIRTHFDKEHSTSTLKCSSCPFETKQQYYFNSHIKNHDIPDKECPYCRRMIKAFSYKMHIKVHERNDQTEYKCSFCNYQSYNHANVKRHTVTSHKSTEELSLFYCDSCSYVTVLEERLKRHKLQIHLKQGVWISCSECEYMTRNKGHMKRHQTKHSEKTVQCQQCPQLFGSQDHLRCHIKRMHSNEDSKTYYYCEMCPDEERYKTTEKGNLARHILAHRTLDEVEAFACHKCSYMGKSRNALKTHLINAHLPEMHNFKCPICGYSTNIKSRFRCHLKEVHGKPKGKNTLSEDTTLEQDLQENNHLDMIVVKDEAVDLDEDNVGFTEEA